MCSPQHLIIYFIGTWWCPYSMSGNTHMHTHTPGTVISELLSAGYVIDQQGIAGERLDIKVPTPTNAHTHTLSLTLLIAPWGFWKQVRELHWEMFDEHQSFFIHFYSLRFIIYSLFRCFIQIQLNIFCWFILNNTRVRSGFVWVVPF